MNSIIWAFHNLPFKLLYADNTKHFTHYTNHQHKRLDSGELTLFLSLDQIQTHLELIY